MNKTVATKPLVLRGLTLDSNSLTVLVISIWVLLFMLFPHYSIDYIAKLTQFTINQFGLGFILFSTAMVVLVLGISISPLGKIRLGGNTSIPEFGTFSWLAMLFTAGMGSGLIFWGIAEPVFHVSNLPEFTKGIGDNTDTALALTYFHWGIHAWAIYAIAGLAIAWFSYNRGRSLHISSTFTSKPGRSVWRIVDWMAIIAILFGVAGTFANTIALIQTGLEQTLSLSIGSIGFRYSLLLLIAVLFTGSSILGLHKGIKLLSQFNTGLMVALAVLVFVLVDPLPTLARMVSSTTSYLAILPEVSFSIAEASRDWSLGWSVIYIVWWVAWAPFVGPFIARISKGRTIRQFLLCAVMVPTLASIVWFSTFGGAALEQSFASEVIDIVNTDYTKGLFLFFEQLPMGLLFSLAAIVLLITFIITSADSALLVCGMLSGSENIKSKILWATILVTLSMALLFVNDVDLNKQVAIVGALPFTLVMVGQVVSMLRDMLSSKA
ncbi:BCCT family transporter [uncultured Vibrio sp.]|uniref:BCCT family transporter n=1 Tax=uncultured Vibrio sp. TaxID=114054 RepID=UPI00263049F3|nr:BCCT family transporter [uncultured Vibrio sp.]